MTQQTERVRRSEPMTEQEHAQFKTWVFGQPTLLDAAATLKIDRSTLDRLISKGSGKPETIAKIRAVIFAS